jgi:hypothetical protein
MRERTGNVVENKGSPWKTCGRTGNVAENKGSYALNAGILLKTQVLSMYQGIGGWVSFPRSASARAALRSHPSRTLTRPCAPNGAGKRTAEAERKFPAPGNRRQASWKLLCRGLPRRSKHSGSSQKMSAISYQQYG